MVATKYRIVIKELKEVAQEYHKAMADGKLTKEEQKAWKTLNLAPVDDFDIVKKQYKQLVKENHPDKNRGDTYAEERLKDINLAYALIRKSLSKGDHPVAK